MLWSFDSVLPIFYWCFQFQSEHNSHRKFGQFGFQASGFICFFLFGTMDKTECYRQKPPTFPKKTATKDFFLNSPRFGLAAGISSHLHRPAWSGFNPASLSAWEMRNFAALEELDKHKEWRPQRAEISQTSAVWQAGQPGLILEWWLLPSRIDAKFQALETLKNTPDGCLSPCLGSQTHF